MRWRIVNNIFFDVPAGADPVFSAGGGGFRLPPFLAPSSVIC